MMMVLMLSLSLRKAVKPLLSASKLSLTNKLLVGVLLSTSLKFLTSAADTVRFCAGVVETMDLICGATVLSAAKLALILAVVSAMAMVKLRLFFKAAWACATVMGVGAATTLTLDALLTALICINTFA